MSRTNSDFLITLLPSETDRVDELLYERETLIDTCHPGNAYEQERVASEVADIERTVGLLLVRAMLRS